jgi:hypothetical protein
MHPAVLVSKDIMNDIGEYRCGRSPSMRTLSVLARGSPNPGGLLTDAVKTILLCE